jgi:tryptophan-rich sensory protein
VFGPVWTFLYVLIAISFGVVFYKFITGYFSAGAGVATGQPTISALVALPFALNLVFNFSFTYFQFKLKNNYLAALDILLTLATLIWATLAILPLAPWLAAMQIPYLLWVAFATTLQLTVTWLNR